MNVWILTDPGTLKSEAFASEELAKRRVTPRSGYTWQPYGILQTYARPGKGPVADADCLYYLKSLAVIGAQPTPAPSETGIIPTVEQVRELMVEALAPDCDHKLQPPGWSSAALWILANPEPGDTGTAFDGTTAAFSLGAHARDHGYTTAMKVVKR